MDMRPAEFRALVDARALPQPIEIGDFVRWRVSDLEALKAGPSFDEEFET
jgi:predicted DNA-binding transcriptional regulator AlpA